MLFLSNLAVVSTVLSLVAASPGPIVRRGSPCKMDNNMVPWNAYYGTGVIPSGIETCLGSQRKYSFLVEPHSQLTNHYSWSHLSESIL
jgi:hypothetical protein